MCNIVKENFDKVFIERTLSIVNSPDKNMYEVSLLVNCLCGLIVLPVEYYKRNKYSFFEVDLYSIKEIKHLVSGVFFHPTTGKRKGKYSSKPKTLANFLFSIRNGISHQRIECAPEDQKWRKIIIKDINSFNKKGDDGHLELSLIWTIDQLREFCVFVSNRYLAEISKVTQKYQETGFWH